jgi:hypothetical protein
VPRAKAAVDKGAKISGSLGRRKLRQAIVCVTYEHVTSLKRCPLNSVDMQDSNINASRTALLLSLTGIRIHSSGVSLDKCLPRPDKRISALWTVGVDWSFIRETR